MEVEVEFWRVLCRQPSIRQAVDLLCPLLDEYLGARAVILRRIDHETSRLETVAAAGLGPKQARLQASSSLEDGGYHALLAWIRRGEVLLPGVPEHQDLLRLVEPSGLDVPAIAGPLMGLDRPIGVALFLGAGRGGQQQRGERVKRLMMPCATALEHDERIRELVHLREALEADRSALLQRLQRQDISEAIVGEQGGLRDVMVLVGQVAHTEAPVLLMGETGSGKEVIARAIHARSSKAQGPMLKVNCGAIPAGLVDSELFGHERGSFTGASERRQGWFERADGGTLFLDEVGELPLAAQVRLLRVLQDGTLVRVGGQRTIKVDVRIVAATHRRLDEMVEAGTFREDLWYRIGVFPIRLPPLRERPEDIPDLAAHFAWRSGKRLGGLPLSPTQEDVRLLLAYTWPGNVRELASVIERATILGDGKRLEIAAALGYGVATGASATRREAAGPGVDSANGTLDDAIVERIQAALMGTGGRIEGPGGAAEQLGINPHTLRSRMRKLGIDWRRFRT